MAGYQRLEFPRNRQCEPWYTIPRNVKRAVCEQAVWILTNGATGGQSERQALQAAGVTQFTVGHLSETFEKRSGPSISLAPKALALIQSYLARGGHLIGSQEVALADTDRGQFGWQLS